MELLRCLTFIAKTVLQGAEKTIGVSGVNTRPNLHTNVLTNDQHTKKYIAILTLCNSYLVAFKFAQ